MPKKRRASGSPPANISVSYTLSSDFRMIVAHGALIRPIQDSLIITFYADDRRAISQEGRLLKQEPTTYELGNVTEVAERLQQVAIQLSLPDAVALAAGIIDRVKKERPGFIDDVVSPTVTGGSS